MWSRYVVSADKFISYSFGSRIVVVVASCVGDGASAGYIKGKSRQKVWLARPFCRRIDGCIFSTVFCSLGLPHCFDIRIGFLRERDASLFPDDFATSTSTILPALSTFHLHEIYAHNATHGQCINQDSLFLDPFNSQYSDLQRFLLLAYIYIHFQTRLAYRIY